MLKYKLLDRGYDMKVMPRFGLILDKRYTLAELIDRLLADGNGSSATILAITNPNFDEYHYNISDYPSLEFNHGKIQRDDIPEELKYRNVRFVTGDEGYGRREYRVRT